MYLCIEYVLNIITKCGAVVPDATETLESSTIFVRIGVQLQTRS